jgi:hypothetical protein
MMSLEVKAGAAPAGVGALVESAATAPDEKRRETARSKTLPINGWNGILGIGCQRLSEKTAQVEPNGISVVVQFESASKKTQ